MNAFDPAKKLCVVLDANVWIGQMLLNSALGAAFLYRVRSLNAVIGLPEVVELEVSMRTKQEAREARGAVERNLAKVRTLVGETQELDLPTDQDFATAIQDRFSELANFIDRLPLKPEHYRQALMSVISGLAPNATKEQYRNTLIWEAIKDIPKNYEVAFVTNDRDFYESKDPQKGLASELTRQASGLSVFLFSNLEQFLGSFKEKVAPPDYDRIALIISEEIKESVLSWAESGHFSVGELTAHSIEAFVTERIGVLSLSFKLTYRIFNVVETQAIQDGALVKLRAPIEHAEATLVCSGDCYFHEVNETVTEMRPHDFDCFDLNGRELIGFGGGNMYGHAGPRTIPHRVLRPIDQT